MTSPLLESRRELRKCAFQALMALEYDGDIVEACRFAYLHDKRVTFGWHVFCLSYIVYLSCVCNFHL